MDDWKQELGKHFLQHSAMSYVVTDDDLKVSWGRQGRFKPQIDMVVFFKDHIRIIELKETDSESHRKVRTPQVERYYHLCKNVDYDTQGWVYMYWRTFNTIVGAQIDRIDEMHFFVEKKHKQVTFWVGKGDDPNTQLKQEVDFRMEL